MAARTDLGDKAIIFASKSYSLKEGLKDLVSGDSPGVEELALRVVEEAKEKIEEGEKVEEVQITTLERNMALHFLVALVVSRDGGDGSSVSS